MDEQEKTPPVDPEVFRCIGQRRDGKPCRRIVAEAGKTCPLHGPDAAQKARELSDVGNARFRKPLPVPPLRTADEMADCVERLVADVRRGKVEARVLTAVTGACKFLAELRGLTGARPSPEDAFDEAARNARRPAWNAANLYATDGNTALASSEEA